MSEAPALERTRKNTAPGMTIHLPPEIMRAAEMAAEAAGMTAETLIVDSLRDVFEPVFDGRGKRAVEAKRDAA